MLTVAGESMNSAGETSYGAPVGKSAKSKLPDVRERGQGPDPVTPNLSPQPSVRSNT
ncbi:hypothetical protein BDM02DRAFT_3120141 [Thelephora ganbajun]|uniref:Uncharacterized protein n=1 Tax=Thelephora ganbajun TaxID=370292 RepID=A0ACB6Z7I2_THEGA|nr:hypothetical protein BDM02DRAFT_3120141 [Thelephora ganbajun]